MYWMRVLVLPVAIVAISITTTLAGTNELQPKRHFKIERPASLTNSEALTIYDNVADQMARGYTDSGDPAAKALIPKYARNRCQRTPWGISIVEPQ